MRWATILAVTIALVIYVILGALIFYAIEKDVDQAESKVAQEFLDNNQCVTLEEFEDLVKKIGSLSKKGIYLSPNGTNQLDIPSSVFFVTTIITTVGYGNTAPKTAGGKIFCIFYAIIGIPMALVFLTGLGEKMALWLAKVYEWCNCCSSWPRLSKFIRMFLIAAAGWLIFVAIAALLFQRLEGWSYGDSMYYALMTFNTVGFGDYVLTGALITSTIGRAAYRILMAIWIFLGLAWVAAIIRTIRDYFKEFFKKSVDKVEERIKTIQSRTGTLRGSSVVCQNCRAALSRPAAASYFEKEDGGSYVYNHPGYIDDHGQPELRPDVRI